MKTKLIPITIGMQNEELVNALNNNFIHLENAIKEGFKAQGEKIAEGMTKGHAKILNDINNLFGTRINEIDKRVKGLEDETEGQD